MNQTHPTESSRIAQELYRAMTPKKTRTFSENMLKRRKPFLGTEDYSNPSPLAISKNNERQFKEQLKHNDKETEPSLRSPDNKRKKNNFKLEDTKQDFVQRISSVGSCENIQATEINVRSSNIFNPDEKLENLLRIKNDIEKLQKSEKFCRKSNDQFGTNGMETQFKEVEGKLEISDINLDKCMKTRIGEWSTEIKTNNGSVSGYYSQESINEISSLDNETSIENFHKELNPLTNSTFIYPRETIKTETSYSTNESRYGSGTFLLEDNRKANINQYNEHGINDDCCFSKNFQIPVIIINEINIIDKKKETEMGKFKTLKVSAIPKISEYGENKELQKKIEQELFELIEIKDKVMAQLLEMAHAIDFPKLKHLCNMECEKGSDGLCKKIKKVVENNAKQHQQQYNGFFHYIWSSIKYRFVSKSPITEKKEETPKMEKIEKKDETINRESQISKEKNKHEIKIITVEEEQQKPIGIEEVKLQHLLDVGKENKVTVEELKISIDSTQQEYETVNLQKTKGDEYLKDATEQHDTNFKIEENQKGIDLEKEEKYECENRNENLISDSKDASDLANKIESGKPTEQTLTNQNNENNKVITLENHIENKNTGKEKLKIDVKIRSHSVYYSRGIFQKKNGVISKLKKRFPFFKRANETERKQNKAEEKLQSTSKANVNIIDSMEDKFKELEKSENKISDKALKKLENFMALKNEQQPIESKAKTKRSGSV